MKAIKTEGDFSELSEKEMKVFENTKKKIEKIFTKRNVGNKDNIDMATFYPGKVVMSDDNVIAIGYKSYGGYKLLEEFVDKELIKDKPNLDYGKDKSYEGCIKSTYDLNRLGKIIEIFKQWDIKAEFYMRYEYPITIENEDFYVILAPSNNN